MLKLRVVLLSAGVLTAITALSACGSSTSTTATGSSPAGSATNSVSASSSDGLSGTSPAASGAASPKATATKVSGNTLANGAHSVYVRTLATSDLSAVVEPMKIVSATEYCQNHKIPTSDDRCSADWQSEDSGKIYPVNLSSTTTYFVARKADGTLCANENSVIGTCKVTVAEFAKLTNDRTPAQITITNGAVTKLAQLHTSAS